MDKCTGHVVTPTLEKRTRLSILSSLHIVGLTLLGLFFYTVVLL